MTPPGLGVRRRALGVSALAFLSIVGLYAILAGTAPRRTYGHLPANAAGSALRYPVAVGATEAPSPLALEYLLARESPGAIASVGEWRVKLVPELSGTLFVVTLLSALAFWAVATFALTRRAGKAGVPDLHAGLLAAAVAIAVGGVWPATGTAGTLRHRTLVCLALAGFAFMPICFLRFTLVFPRPVLRGRWYAGVGALLLGLATGVMLWNVDAWFSVFASPDAKSWQRVHMANRALEIGLVAGLVSSIAVLAWNGRRTPVAREKRQVRWILWGTAVGATPYVLFRVLPRLLGAAESTVDPLVDRVAELALPATFTIAVVREQLFDIDLILRRSILYTVLAAIAAVPLWLAVLLVGRSTSIPREYVWALAGGLAVVLFFAARRGVAAWIDRSLFGIRHRHGEAIADVDRRLANAKSPAEVGDRLRYFIDDVLTPRRSSIVMGAGSARETLGEFPPPLALSCLDALEPLTPSDGRVLAARDATGLPEVESDAFPRSLREAGVVLVQPLAVQDAVEGAILLGPRRNDRRYVLEDLELLEAIGRRAGEALHRMALSEHALRASMARRAISREARRRSEFFSRLAHVLRTPLTAIRWSVENLLDEIPGPLTASQRAYLEGLSTAAAQLSRLVANVGDLSRLDGGDARLRLEAVDVDAIVRHAVESMKPVARARRADIRLRRETAVPAVSAHPEGLLQIVVNLLDNGLQHTPKAGTVEVVLAAESPDTVTIGVRDHGPGLPDGAQQHLFSLFAEDPDGPPGAEKGFGIGLHVAQAWARRFDGRIDAGNADGGGACFVCRLPAWRGDVGMEELAP